MMEGHFSRRLLQDGGPTTNATTFLSTTPKIPECDRDKYENCFRKCPPQIPGPPPPPLPELKDYKPPWCTALKSNWSCQDSQAGPVINGINPRLPASVEDDDKAMQDLTIAVVVPILVIVIAIIVIVIVCWLKKRQAAKNEKVDNTYNLGQLAKHTVPPVWTEHDHNEGLVEDGSEIFYQVDRSAMNNGVAAGMRSVPDVVYSSTFAGTLNRSGSKSPDMVSNLTGRSGSAASTTPLLPETPEYRRHQMRMRRATGSDITAPVSPHPDEEDNLSAMGTLSHPANPSPMGSPGYNTYNPTQAKSHPALNARYSMDNAPRTPNIGSRTPENRPRPLRKASASSINQSDPSNMSKQPIRGADGYRDNWNNFEEVTATMRKNKKRELILGADSFIDSYNAPEPEDTVTVDQLGMPTRNPFLAGFYDDEDSAPPSVLFPDDEPLGDDSVLQDDPSADYVNQQAVEGILEEPDKQRHNSADRHPSGDRPKRSSKKTRRSSSGSGSGSRRNSSSSRPHREPVILPDPHRRQPSAISEREFDSETEAVV